MMFVQCSKPVPVHIPAYHTFDSIKQIFRSFLVIRASSCYESAIWLGVCLILYNRDLESRSWTNLNEQSYLGLSKPIWRRHKEWQLPLRDGLARVKSCEEPFIYPFCATNTRAGEELGGGSANGKARRRLAPKTRELQARM